MGYFQVRYDSRVVIYDCRGFIRLDTGLSNFIMSLCKGNIRYNIVDQIV